MGAAVIGAVPLPHSTEAAPPLLEASCSTGFFVACLTRTLEHRRECNEQ